MSELKSCPNPECRNTMIHMGRASLPYDDGETELEARVRELVAQKRSGQLSDLHTIQRRALNLAASISQSKGATDFRLIAANIEILANDLLAAIERLEASR